MADLMSLYADLHGVRAQDPMLQGITQASVLGEKEQALMALQRALEYQSSNRGGGAAGGMGKAADKLRAHQQQNKYLETLQGALNNQQGLDQYQAQIQAIQQQIQAEEEMRAKQQAAQAAGWGGASDAVAMGMKAPKDNRTVLERNIAAMGIDPRSPEGRKLIEQNLTKSGVTVNTGKEGPQIGTIPPGHILRQDESGGYRMEQIPGSPQEAEAAALEAKATGRTAQTRRAGTTVVQDLGRGLQLMPEIEQGDGIAGSNLRIAKSRIAGTPEYQVLQFKESALSNVGLDTLQQMRENSPTGGALGQVPIQQQKRLEQVLGSLELGQKPADIEANMQRIMNIYTDIMYGSPEERAVAVAQGKMTPEQSAEIDARYFELPFDDMGRPIETSGNSTQGQAGGQVYENPQTGEKIRWDGKQWVVVQ